MHAQVLARPGARRVGGGLLNRVAVVLVIGLLIVILLIDNYRLSGELFQVDQLTDGKVHHETIEVGLAGIALVALL